MRFFRSQRGFTLIELVTTLILVGMIGAFAGFFLYTGVRGFLTSRFSSETALQAQIALDRIGSELRHIQAFVNPAPTSTNIGYRSLDPVLFPGDRRIIYSSANREITLSVDGNSNVLLDNVSSFSFSRATGDLDNSGDGNYEISEIRVAFTVRSAASGNETGFSTEIYPRSMLAALPF
jgi:prepilin-type N-terminal cleavage/methylation domain-containing protein